ncbi:methylglyoxal synthase [Salmonella enterica subsp. enterica]|nr:methylglyoxal synthase [Salmonella enterica subsp. enterica]
MELTTRTLPTRKHIALVAHDHCKQMLMNWVERHQPLLEKHVLYATGTTGNLIQRATGMDVNAMLSGPMGGRPAGWRTHFRRENRRVDFLLGPA